MKTFLGVNKTVNTEIGAMKLEVMVESRSGKLNPQTGKIMRINDLNNAINELMLDELLMKPIKGFKYLPQTLEVMASRLWEHIEENLNFEARMARLKLSNDMGFVVYDGRREEQVLMQQPMPQPKHKYKKRRPING